MIYFIIIFSACVLAMPKKNIKLVSDRRSNKVIFSISDLYVVTLFLVFIAVAFRGSSVGTDTLSYMQKYQVIMYSESYSAYGGFGFGEPLFYFIVKFLSSVFGEWSRCIFVLEGVLLVSTFSWLIKNYSSDPSCSVLCFLSFGLFLSSLCLLRQFMALSFCFLALPFAFERKGFQFTLLVIIASLIHYSAVVFLIVYIVSGLMKCNNKNVILLLLGSILAFFLVDKIQVLLSRFFVRWSKYDHVETVSQGYISFAIFSIITLLFTFFKREIIRLNKYGGALLNMNYINFAIWSMRLVTRSAERVSFYFILAPVLLIPTLFLAVDERFGRRVGQFFRVITVLLLSVFFIYKVFNSGDYYPYRFGFK